MNHPQADRWEAAPALLPTNPTNNDQPTPSLRLPACLPACLPVCLPAYLPARPTHHSPTASTTQIFRVFYSVVAGVTLGGSFGAFQNIQLASPVLDWTVPLTESPQAMALLFGVASIAQGISLASLVNPSPLSLVPGFGT